MRHGVGGGRAAGCRGGCGRGECNWWLLIRDVLLVVLVVVVDSGGPWFSQWSWRVRRGVRGGRTAGCRGGCGGRGDSASSLLSWLKALIVNNIHQRLA